MYRLRIKFKKQESLRFLSHLELISAFERAVRRASFPFLLTQGFNQRMKISWGIPTSVGMQSEAEYLDLFLSTRISEEQAVKKLNGVLPKGLSVSDAKYVSLRLPSLMSTINAVTYKVIAEIKGKLDSKRLELATRELLAKDKLTIERRGGKKTVDLKPALAGITAKLRSGFLELALVLSVGERNHLKPEEVIKALADDSSVPFSCEVVKIERKGLYLKSGSKFFDPLNISEGGEKQAS